MRLVGEIEHPVMKISIFKMGERFSVKFEHKGVEVTYKFSDEEGASDLGRLKKEMMDEDFIKKVGKQIHEMIPIVWKRSVNTCRNLWKMNSMK
ncbi:MAG: hypothetical protein R2769_16340 [Saprospiraceae bacterium]